jgi:hypothetical protein
LHFIWTNLPNLTFGRIVQARSWKNRCCAFERSSPFWKDKHSYAGRGTRVGVSIEQVSRLFAFRIHPPPLASCGCKKGHSGVGNRRKGVLGIRQGETVYKPTHTSAAPVSSVVWLQNGKACYATIKRGVQYGSKRLSLCIAYIISQ